MTKKKKEEPQDFLAVIKLVSGEEVISTVTSCEEDNRTLLLLENPVVFESVIPITIDSNALEPAPAGTVYTAEAEAPVDVFTFVTANLLKSLAIFYSFLLFILS